jgi:hypothetical protein
MGVGYIWLHFSYLCTRQDRATSRSFLLFRNEPTMNLPSTASGHGWLVNVHGQHQWACDQESYPNEVSIV